MDVIQSWEQKDGNLVREFVFENFVAAVRFVDRIVPLSEKMDHHPDILIHSYKRVRVMLRTHSKGRITELDYELAGKIDELR